MQAIQAEVSRATCAMNGLPAAVSSVCKNCDANVRKTVLFAGHECLPYLITIDKDPKRFQHTKDEGNKMAKLPSVEEAHQRLALKKAKLEKDWGTRLAKRQRTGHQCYLVNYVFTPAYMPFTQY